MNTQIITKEFPRIISLETILFPLSPNITLLDIANRKDGECVELPGADIPAWVWLRN
jgi:hypothetical protein